MYFCLFKYYLLSFTNDNKEWITTKLMHVCVCMCVRLCVCAISEDIKLTISTYEFIGFVLTTSMKYTKLQIPTRFSL